MQSMQRAIYLHALHAYLINREYLIIFYVGGGGWGGGGTRCAKGVFEEKDLGMCG